MVNILSKMKEEAEGNLKLVWKKIEPKDLKRGEHIYCHKKCGSYTHHGIYVGGERVIHFTRTEPKKAKVFPLPKSQPSVDRSPCQECGYDKKKHLGVVKTCLVCFRLGKVKLHSIRYYAYGAPKLGHRLKKSGTCTMLVCNKSEDEVVKTAEDLLHHGNKDFDKYDLKKNNCEHFATYCKTGQRHCEQMSFYNKAGEWLSVSRS